MCEHGSEKRDFHVPVESYDAETDKEIQQKLLELEWVDDLVYYDSVASELRKGVSVPNPRSNDFSGWVPEPGATATEKPRRSDKTTKASQKDHLYAHSYKSKDIMYIFRHYVNTAMYIEQYRQEHTYSGMFRRERNLDHRALSESSLNRIQRRSQRLKPELLQPPAHIRFQHQPSSETTEFIELARQYKVNATPEVLKRPDNDAHLGGVSVMQLGRRSPALMVNRPASGSSDRGGVMLKCRGLQTMNLSIPRKGGPKAKSQQNRVDSATQNCFSGRPMKPFPANGHCNVEELAPHKTLMVTPTNLRTLDLLSSVAIIDKQHTSGNQPTGNQLMNASDQSDPIDASDFVEPTDLVSTETNQDSDDNLVESPREDMIEESPVNPLPPPLTFQVVKKFPEANPDFSINPHPTLQIEGGKIRKRKKKHTSKSLRAKRHLVFPKLESSVDQFHQTPRGNPLGKSYMLVSQGLSRQPLTDDHSVNEKNSHKKSDLYSPRTSTDSSTVKSDLFDREKAATVLEESKLDTLQKECTNSTLGKTVSIMSTSNIELLPTDKHGKCEMMKHYLLDLAADEEDWRLWQQLKATPVEAFDFTAPDEQKTYLDADVAENIEALHKKLTLSCGWSHHPCPVAVFGQKSMTFSRRNPLPLSTAMKNGSLKDMKKLAVTQSQLLPKGSGSHHVASTATTMAHAVYSFFQSHRVPECVGLPFTCTRIQHKQPTSQLPTAKPISADTRHGCYELMLV